jgi:hypothetical protein
MFKGSKLLTLHEDRTYPCQFISIMSSELVSTTIELRTQWMWRFSTETIVSTNLSSSCFNSNSSSAILGACVGCDDRFFFGTSLRTLSTWPTLTYWGLICLFPELALAGSHLFRRAQVFISGVISPQWGTNMLRFNGNWLICQQKQQWSKSRMSVHFLTGTGWLPKLE